jgi:hypothetical protein
MEEELLSSQRSCAQAILDDEKIELLLDEGGGHETAEKLLAQSPG